MTVSINGRDYTCHSVNAILDAKRHMIENNKHKLDIDHIMSTYDFNTNRIREASSDKEFNAENDFDDLPF